MMNAMVEEVFLTRQIDSLFAYIIDNEGSISTLPIAVALDKLERFTNLFETQYLLFRDSKGNILFEVSQGLLCYVNEESGLTRGEVRRALYSCGIKSIK